MENSEQSSIKNFIQETTSTPWWEQIVGTFANNAAYDAAMQSGKKYRLSTRRHRQSQKP